MMTVQASEAKTPAYVITGGELGPYAFHLFLVSEEQGEVQLLAEGPEDPPAALPAIAYDLYSSYGNFAVADQIAQGGPESRYYPDVGLMHHRQTDSWQALTVKGKAFMQAAIDDALLRKAAGELELGPIRADFRARHLAEATYTLNSWSEDFRPLDFRSFGEPWLGGSKLGKLSGPPAENFVMGELVATLGRTPRGSPPAVARVAISYSAWDAETRTGYGGLLGFYSPPEGGRPGLFWHDGHFYDGNTPYYETTAGFNAIIAGVLARPPVIALPEAGGGESSLAWIVAAVSFAIGGSLLLVIFRRR
jgi:hypothetical protein